MSRRILIGLGVWLLAAMPLACCFARPQYRAAIEKEYRKFGVINCTVCHEGEDKRQRTDYAKKLEEALGERNVKDEAKILAATKKAGPPPEQAAKPAAAAPAQPVVRAAIRIAAPAVVVQRAVEVDEDGNEVVVQAQRFSISHQNLDQWIFGANKTVEQARTEFESQLKSRIDALAKQYELDATQRRKLQLAGRGDIKRFLGEAETLHAELGTATGTALITLEQQQYVDIQQRAIALRNRFASAYRINNVSVTGSLFDDQSLLSKTIPHAISPKFAEQYLAELKRQRDEQYETYLTQSIQNLTTFLGLREEQKGKLKDFIRTEIAPPPRFNQYVYTYVMYHLSKLPDEKLGKLLDETQISKFGVIKGNAARYEEYLRAYGLLTDELEEEQREDSR